MFRTVVAAVVSMVALQGCVIVCYGPDPACDEMAVASVTVQVASDADRNLEDAQASFRVDGGELQPCERMDAITFACGWEQPGLFEIEVSAPDHAPQVIEVEVFDGECHVEQEELFVELRSEPVCTATIEPSVVLADEPTGNLDSTTSRQLWSLLRTITEQRRITMVLVTHEASAAVHRWSTA